MNTRRILISLAMTAGAVFVWAATAAAAPPANTTPPSITGTTKVGETLTAQNGTWTNSPTSFQYQWQRCDGAGASCVNIGGAVEKAYLLKPADATHTLRARVLAVNADGSATARSGPTAVVGAGTAPVNSARPSISGDARVGETLTADDGTWSNTPTSFAYQWQRCDADGTGCAAISGSTAKTYGVRLVDLGFRLRVEVTAKNAGGAGSALSGLSPIVDPTRPITNKRPTLTVISVRFVGARVYARIRICDDTRKNLTIIAKDSRPGKASYTRRFTTRIAPNPCGAYTRNWVPAQRFRGKGRYMVTLQARDTSGLTSAPGRRSFSR